MTSKSCAKDRGRKTGKIARRFRAVSPGQLSRGKRSDVEGKRYASEQAKGTWDDLLGNNKFLIPDIYTP